MVTKKRSSLSPITIQEAQCLRSWWQHSSWLALNKDALPCIPILKEAEVKEEAQPDSGDFEPEPSLSTVLEGEVDRNHNGCNLQFTTPSPVLEHEG